MSETQTVQIRPAVRGDLSAIIAMLADDALGTARENVDAGSHARYEAAFEKINKDVRNHLMVAETNGVIVGTYQVTYIPYLSRGGNERALIEAVRVASKLRGRGIGRQMMLYAIAQAKHHGCLLAQLTTDKQRTDAHRFYASLGFVASHEGMKLTL